MLLRPTTDADVDHVLRVTSADRVGSVPADSYRAGLAARHYRPEWTWVADDAGPILARAVWWGFSDADHPLALDGVDVHASVAGRSALAARLIAAGHAAFRASGAPQPPQFDLNVPHDWRTDPAVTRSLGWRRRAASLAGLTDELERLRYEWTPGAGVPGRPGRLTFRTEPDDAVVLDAFRRIAVGSLDVTTRRDVTALGADRQAREDMQIYLSMPGDRAWWRLAYTPGRRARRARDPVPERGRAGRRLPRRRAGTARPGLHQ